MENMTLLGKIVVRCAAGCVQRIWRSFATDKPVSECVCVLEDRKRKSKPTMLIKCDMEAKGRVLFSVKFTSLISFNLSNKFYCLSVCGKFRRSKRLKKMRPFGWWVPVRLTERERENETRTPSPVLPVAGQTLELYIVRASTIRSKSGDPDALQFKLFSPSTATP